MKTYTFFHDPGHGWLRVTHAELHALGIADKITPYSYTHGRHAYLEEDCDLSTFLAAFRQRYQCEPKIIDQESEAIRGYEPYKPAPTRPPYQAGQQWKHPATGALIQLIAPRGPRLGWECIRADLNLPTRYRASFRTLARFQFKGIA